MNDLAYMTRCPMCAGSCTVYRRHGFESAAVDCPHCSGAGSVESPEPSPKQLAEEIGEGLSRLGAEIALPSKRR